MKKLSILTIFLLSTIHIIAQLKSQVNECFELTSIAFRLADASEYSNNLLIDYSNDIDHYFVKYKDHKLILYIKEIREKQGIGYDAVSSAASFLDIKNGKVTIRSDVKISQISEIDKRWTEQSFKTFVSLLNNFYQKAKFRSFFIQQIGLYRLAEERMDEQLKNFNIDWFKTIFEEEILSPMVVVSPSNGPHNYAFHIPAQNSINGMVIGCGSDKDGQPAFNPGVMRLITHEFLHNYTNKRISSCWNQIDSAAQIIYSPIKEDMRRNAYIGAETTMYEWFTNLITIMYLKENSVKDFSLENTVRDYQTRGFIWMDRSVAFMEHFRDNQNLYATIDGYMPQIVGFINNTATNFDQVLNEFNNRHPYVIDIFPAPNSINKLNIDTIIIRFSEPMFVGAHGMSPIDDKNTKPIHWLTMPFWKDERTFVIVLNNSKFEKGRKYGFYLDKDFFQSAKKYPMKEDYEYTFKTSEE